MEQDKHFLKSPEVFHFNLKRKEQDLFIHMIGYHNFHYISPEQYPRKQRRYTLHFILSGRGYLTVNGEKFTIYPYDVFCLDNECTFYYYPDKTTRGNMSFLFLTVGTSTIIRPHQDFLTTTQ